MIRKLIALSVLIIICLLSFACSQKDIDKINEETISKLRIKEEPLSQGNEEKLMKEFSIAVSSDNEPYTLVKFIDAAIGNLSKDHILQMVKDLLDVQEEYIEKYTDELFMEERQMELLAISEIDCSEGDLDNHLFFNKEKIEDIKNEKLKQLVDRIIGGRYKLLNAEGAFYPIIDYESYKDYDKYLPDEIKGYLSLKALDSKLPPVLDAEIGMSFDELSKRLIKTENYIKGYPDSPRYEEVLRLYGSYLNLYLGGSDNSPIYDYESKKIKEDILSSYQKTKNINGSITGEIINEYINIIDENDRVIDLAVLSKIVTLHNEAIAVLEEQKNR